MTKIKDLAVGTGYTRNDNTLYLKEIDGATHSKFTIDAKTGAWVVEREREPFDPDEEVVPIIKRSNPRPAAQRQIVQSQRQTLTIPVLMTQIGETWIEHDSLLRSLQQRWVVSELDLTMLLTELRNSGIILRDRRPAGRRVSFHYKKSS